MAEGHSTRRQRAGGYRVLLLQEWHCYRPDRDEEGTIYQIEIGFLSFCFTSLPFVPAKGMELGVDVHPDVLREQVMEGGDDFNGEVVERVAWNATRGWFEVWLKGRFAGSAKTTSDDMGRDWPGLKFVRFINGDDSWLGAIVRRRQQINQLANAVGRTKRA